MGVCVCGGGGLACVRACACAFVHSDHALWTETACSFHTPFSLMFEAPHTDFSRALWTETACGVAAAADRGLIRVLGCLCAVTPVVLSRNCFVLPARQPGYEATREAGRRHARFHRRAPARPPRGPPAAPGRPLGGPTLQAREPLARVRARSFAELGVLRPFPGRRSRRPSRSSRAGWVSLSPGDLSPLNHTHIRSLKS